MKPNDEIAVFGRHKDGCGYWRGLDCDCGLVQSQDDVLQALSRAPHPTKKTSDAGIEAKLSKWQRVVNWWRKLGKK